MHLEAVDGVKRYISCRCCDYDKGKRHECESVGEEHRGMSFPMEYKEIGAERSLAEEILQCSFRGLLVWM